MIKFLRYTEYLYLAVAIISIYKVSVLWGVDPKEAYVFIFFAVVSIGMFLFRRRYRKRFEERKKENQK
ncbi:MAG: hypothetical protein ABJN84_03710 [Flavobacteriaceae bacterium]